MKKTFSRILGTMLLCLVVGMMINQGFMVFAVKFSPGDIVEVINTLDIGLAVRDAPAGNIIGRKYDGSRGMILAGPQNAYYAGVLYTWWKIRWADDVGLEGWSAEGYPGGVDYLKYVYVPLSSKFNIGDFVKVYGTGGLGLKVRSDPPELVRIGVVSDGTFGKVVGGPFYGVGKYDPAYYYESGFHHFWKIDYGSIVGWSAEDYLVKTILPDLIVENIMVEPDPPSPGGSTTWGITIKNQGAGDAVGTFFLECYFDGTYIGHVYVNGLPAGSTYTSYWRAIVWPSDTNPHTIKGVVDPDNKIIESNENNNVKSKSFQAVSPPIFDFTVNISPSSGSVQQGESTSATVTVRLTSGSAQIVALTASGLPSRAYATFSPSSGYPTFTSTFTISTSTTTPTGTFQITIMGSGGDITRTATYTLTVTPQPRGWTGTVYIRADGSIDPPDSPVITYDYVTYMLTDNIMSSADGIVVERDNIVIEGVMGGIFSVQGAGASESKGIDLSGRDNVTVSYMQIKYFYYGIYLYYSSNNTIIENNIANNAYGIGLYYSSNNTISGNNIANNLHGMFVYSSPNNVIWGNQLTNNYDQGIILWFSSNNIVTNNKVANNNRGITLDRLSGTFIANNNIVNNTHGILLHNSSNNLIYRNELVNNRYQVYDYSWNYPHIPPSINVWDDGYPSGGNYWSDYRGVDYYSGPNQDQPESDGIGDTPYIINENNKDRYPLMKPWTPTPPSPRPKIYVQPATNIFTTDVTKVGDTFAINISTSGWEPPGLYSYELKLYFDPTLLEAVKAEYPPGHFLPDPFTMAVPPTIKAEKGYVLFGMTLLGDIPGSTGSGVLASVTFKIIKAPPPTLSCNLEIKDVILHDPACNLITEYDIEYGYYEFSLSIPKPPVASFTYSPEEPITGETVTFDASASYDPDGGPIVNYRWEFYRLTDEGAIIYPSIEIIEGADKAVVTYSFGKGSYLIVLTVVDDEGVTSKSSKTLYVRAPLICVVKLQKDGVEIDEIGVREFFDIYVGDSIDGKGIKEVRFSSDESQDGNPPAPNSPSWTKWYDWDVSLGDWNAETKIMRWSFATVGAKEVWAEVKDVTGQTEQDHANIFVLPPVLITGDEIDFFGLDKLFVSFLEQTVGIPLYPYVYPLPLFLQGSVQGYDQKVNIVLVVSQPPIEAYRLVRIRTPQVKDSRYLKLQVIFKCGLIERLTDLRYFIAREYMEWKYKFGEKLFTEVVKLVTGMITPGAYLLDLVDHIDYIVGDMALTLKGWTPGEEYLVYLPVGITLTIEPVRDLRDAPCMYTTSPWIYCMDLPGQVKGGWRGLVPASNDVGDIYVPIEETENRWAKFFKLDSPAELRVYDSYGRVTGIVNGQIVEDIPNSRYYENNSIVGIFFPTDSYVTEVVGTDIGAYELEIVSVANGEASIVIAKAIPTSPGVVHQYTVDWDALSRGEEGVNVMVDADGDGVFEHTFTSDSELTHDEFLSETVSWEYVFEDPVRYTILKVSTDDGMFQFITLSKDYGIRKATLMYEGYVTLYHNGGYVKLPAVILKHSDGDLRIEAYAGMGTPFCYARALDYKTGKRYMLIVNPP